MTRYVLIRVLQGIITLLVATVIIFLLARATGDPWDILLGQDVTQEQIDALKKYMGFDKPLYVQYWKFVSNAVTGDFGNSAYHRRPVMGLIMERFPATLQLALASGIVSLLISLPFGVLAAVNREKWQDMIAKVFAILGQSLPTFWLGIMLIQIFGVMAGLLPAGGYGSFKHLILPAIAMGYHSTAGVLRLTRSSMLDVLRSDFVRLARIKGVPESVVIWKHALRNALIPVVTFIGLFYVVFLTGSVVTETVFAWPGVGRLAYEAVGQRDFPLIQGIVIIFVAIFVFVNLLVDITYVYLDPRIRYIKE